MEGGTIRGVRMSPGDWLDLIKGGQYIRARVLSFLGNGQVVIRVYGRDGWPENQVRILSANDCSLAPRRLATSW